MNPSTPTPHDDADWLEQALRADAREHRADYVDDAGFAARVMAALPSPLAALPAWRRPAVAAIWAVAVAGLAVALPGVALDVGREAFRLLATQPVSLASLGVALVVLGAGTFAAAGWALRAD